MSHNGLEDRLQMDKTKCQNINLLVIPSPVDSGAVVNKMHIIEMSRFYVANVKSNDVAWPYLFLRPTENHMGCFFYEICILSSAAISTHSNAAEWNE